MNSPPLRLLFAAYYRMEPTAQIGVMKRCLRIIEKLPRRVEIHLIVVGLIPESEPLFRKLRPRIRVHRYPDSIPILNRQLDSIAPDALILGETPLRGPLLNLANAAHGRKIPIITIDNFMSPIVCDLIHGAFDFPMRLLTLGLPEPGENRDSGRFWRRTLPLIRLPAVDNGSEAAARCDLTILGYDEETLRRSLQLLDRLPAAAEALIFTRNAWIEPVQARLAESSRNRSRVHGFPTDEHLYAVMSRANLIFAKGGFQQMIESVALGRPFVCQVCGGGIEEPYLPPHCRPWVKFIRKEEDLDACLPTIEAWIAGGGDRPRRWIENGSDTARDAADLLLKMVGRPERKEARWALAV